MLREITLAFIALTFCNKIPHIYESGIEEDRESWYCHCNDEDEHKEKVIGAYGESTRKEAIKKWNNSVKCYKGKS